MFNAKHIKAALLKKLPAVCEFLLPNGHPDGTNWRVGSIKGEDGASLSVRLKGQSKGYWKDYATNDPGGDVLELWKATRKVGFAEALREAQAWLLQPTQRRRSKVSPVETFIEPPLTEPVAMPPGVAAIWEAGVAELAADQPQQDTADAWRHWPAGTAAALVAHGLIGRPRLNGEPHWAFPVQNLVMQVGFHARPVAITAGHPKWTYRPSTKQDGASTPALPYVLGAQEFPTACLVVITEGQWDAIAWAAAIGWLRPGQPWPPGVTVFGIPGGNNWGSLRKHWTPLWPKAADFLLIPDADEAGRAWKTGFAAQLRPHALNLKVWALPDGQDFSDFYQAQPLSCPEMADLIECLGLTAIIS